MQNAGVSLQDTVQVSENAVFRELDGEAVILNLETGTYFGLNESGTRMWNLVQQHGALQKVLEALQQEYNVPPETLREDLLRLVCQLHEKGLLRVTAAQH